MIVDPWGVVLAQAPDDQGFVAADLDFASQDRIRERLPSLRNRKPAAYQWPEETESDPARKAVAGPATANGAP
jgi:predicted amidohydrolase